ncbi:MAG: hypothetical protein JW913_09840 [Chitinispirillaceae bacterium]|nr:hypothetical protein [Chitinispirillaceae bacterium]
MNTNAWMFTVMLAAAFCPRGITQDIDENALFGDTAITMIDSSQLTVASSAVDGVDSTIVSFSGGVTGIGETGLSRDWFKNRNRREIDPTALMLGDLMLDVRLPFGMKAFTDGEIYLSPDSNGLTFAVPELFLDANIGRRVYFRAGKQVLQWGRGYFWNPTDMVNVERKTFIERIGSREGTFGLKTHIPFGTKWNIYGFLDLHKLSSIDSLAGAARFEGLFGGTEAGIALWGKRGKDPIIGLDFSTTILSWSVTGEMSITGGKNYRVLDMEKSAFFSENPSAHSLDSQFVFKDFGNDPVVRLCAGLMRSFDLLDVDDRVMVVGEFYFNQVGDGGNAFEKYHVGKMYESIMKLPGADTVMQQANIALQQGFEFNSLAKFYGAFFVTVSKFLISDMTLQLNGLVNFNHGCAMLTAGVQYMTLHNFSLGCLVTGFVGPEESEYTFTGNGASVRLTAGVTF